MANNTFNWYPKTLLERYFTPTNENLSGERRKALCKNHNLPILQYMYNGNKLEPLKCVVSKRIGFIDLPCFVSGKDKQRFDIDFNHIRQKQLPRKQAGISVDKTDAPSNLFRTKFLDEDIKTLYEFATIMPVSQEIHSYISQDSALGDITLTNFKTDHWPWLLQKEDNYNEFFDHYKVKVGNITYNWTIDHLSNIDYPSFSERIKF